MSVDIAAEYAGWIDRWDSIGDGQPARCRARFAGHPNFLGPVECILQAGHEDATDDDRHAGGDPLFRWTDADAHNQLLMMRVRERLAAPGPGCVVCGGPCGPARVKGCCPGCAAAEIGFEPPQDADGEAA